MGRVGKGRELKGRRGGKGREGKGREGKGRETKGREGNLCRFHTSRGYPSVEQTNIPTRSLGYSKPFRNAIFIPDALREIGVSFKCLLVILNPVGRFRMLGGIILT